MNTATPFSPYLADPLAFTYSAPLPRPGDLERPFGKNQTCGELPAAEWAVRARLGYVTRNSDCVDAASLISLSDQTPEHTAAFQRVRACLAAAKGGKHSPLVGVLDEVLRRPQNMSAVEGALDRLLAAQNRRSRWQAIAICVAVAFLTFGLVGLGIYNDNTAETDATGYLRVSVARDYAKNLVSQEGAIGIAAAHLVGTVDAALADHRISVYENNCIGSEYRALIALREASQDAAVRDKARAELEHDAARGADAPAPGQVR